MVEMSKIIMSEEDKLKRLSEVVAELEEKEKRGDAKVFDVMQMVMLKQEICRMNDDFTDETLFVHI